MQISIQTNRTYFVEVVQYAFVEKDETKKKALHTDIINTTAPFFLEKLDSIAKANGGYLAAGRVRLIKL